MNEIFEDAQTRPQRDALENVSPSAVNVSRADRTLSVVWSETHSSRFNLDDLRSICDCARCRSDREAAEQKRLESPRSLPILGATTRAEISSINHVGRYALGIGWKDGHQSIFTYDYLLGSCRCGQCLNTVDPES
jgi:DUF971 family protein